LVRWDAGTIHDALTAIRFEFAKRPSAMTGWCSSRLLPTSRLVSADSACQVNEKRPTRRTGKGARIRCRNAGIVPESESTGDSGSRDPCARRCGQGGRPMNSRRSGRLSGASTRAAPRRCCCSDMRFGTERLYLICHDLMCHAHLCTIPASCSRERGGRQPNV
jgi:hypothetical protein